MMCSCVVLRKSVDGLIPVVVPTTLPASSMQFMDHLCIDDPVRKDTLIFCGITTLGC